jgi:outer membrane protein insertion porin family
MSGGLFAFCRAPSTLLPMRFCRAAVLALLASLAPQCLAQYTVKRLRFPGATPSYSQQQLEAVAGLKIGQHIGTKEMGEASQRLMDTGAFADIQTTLDGPIASIDVIFKLKLASTGSFLPVSFENFVWFTAAERDAELKKRVPLFSGTIPAASSMQESVRLALEAMLTTRGVPGRVEAQETPSTPTRPTPLFAFRVIEPAILLDSVRLDGIDPALKGAEDKQVGEIVHKPYNEGADRPLDAILLRPYRDTGYIDARIDDLQRTPAPPESGVVKVAVAGKVVGGEPYKVSSITWPGSEFLSREEFAKTVKLRPGDPASDALLRSSYQPVLDAYLRRGYADVSIDTHPQRNAATHTVAYTLSVQPGNIYRVGTLTVLGLSPAARQHFDTLWQQKVGDVYNGVDAFGFLARESTQPWLTPYRGELQTVANPNTKLVDIVFTFNSVKP